MTSHTRLVLVASVLMWSVAVSAQERDVPKDSERLILSGCVSGRTFIISAANEGETNRSGIGEGRRFRLGGSGKLLGEINARKGRRVEITGLVRKSQLGGPGGISIAGGRIRIGGRQPQTSIATDPARDPAYNQAVLDVQGWRALAESCPSR